MEYNVSVIVPVYKAEKYLSKCVDSLLNQTLESLEIILVDDGSPDNCGKMCDEFAKNNENVKVIHIDNGGPSRARNIGIQNASGKYIGFADSDDYVDTHMFFLLFSEAEKKSADIVMCSYAIDDGKNIRKLRMEYSAEYNGRNELINGLAALYSKRSHNGLYSVWNKLFNKKLLLNNNILFDESLIRAEDAWFVFDCLKAAEKFIFINKVLYYYRQVASSTMHTIQDDRYERSKAFRKKLEHEDKKLGITIDYNEFYYEFLYESFIYCRAMLQQNKKEAVKKVLKDKYFYNACRYGKKLPKHLKIMCLLERFRLQGTLTKILTRWGKV